MRSSLHGASVVLALVSSWYGVSLIAVAIALVLAMPNALPIARGIRGLAPGVAVERTSPRAPNSAVSCRAVTSCFGPRAAPRGCAIGLPLQMCAV